MPRYAPKASLSELLQCRSPDLCRFSDAGMRGSDSKSSGLAIPAIMPVATRV